MKRRARILAGGAAAAVAALVCVGLAARCAAPPSRCPEGSVALGPRCCGEGQTLSEHRCTGAPIRCPGQLEPTESGCVPPETRIRVPAGSLEALAPDWEAAGRSDLPRGRVEGFEIDAYEVTEARWAACESGGSCKAVDRSGEPGMAVRVGLDDASAFCGWAGGRLPTAPEHALAGAGSEGRRYPWGATGVVCQHPRSKTRSRQMRVRGQVTHLRGIFDQFGLMRQLGVALLV